jgi:hypothetical protein
MTDADVDQFVAFIKFHRNFTVALDVDKVHQRVAADIAL